MWYYIVLGIFSCYILVDKLIISRYTNPKGAKFKGKNVIVTGASTGLGLAFCQKLLKEGIHSLCIISRNPERLQIAVDTLLKNKIQESQIVVGLTADVGNEEEISKRVEEWIKEHGPPDVVVTCAGAAKPGEFLDCPNSDFQSQINLNYLGTVFTLKAALPSMVQTGKGGHLIIVSSALGLISFTGYSAYSASKYALRGLAESLRNELKMHNIFVSIYYPSNIDSPGFAEENRRKPQLTKEIEGTAALFTPEQAATQLYEGLQKGQFAITSELPIEVLRMSTNSIQPRNYPLLEFLISPLLVPISSLLRTYYDFIVSTSKKDTKSKIQ